MEYQDLEKWKDEELVRRSGSAGPYAELVRRNTEALKESREASNRSSGIMFDLTLILMLIAIIQMVAGIYSLNIEKSLKIIIIIGVCALLIFLFKDLINDWRRD